MGTDIRIGNAELKGDWADRTAWWGVRDEVIDDAPGSRDNWLSCQAGSGGFWDFAEAVGLADWFESRNWADDLITLNQADTELIVAHLDEFLANPPKPDPVIDPVRWAEFPVWAAWFRYWTLWAFANCERPSIDIS